MKFTSEDLMKAMGLAVGDKIKFYNEVFTIIENIPNYIGIENDTALYNIDILLNKEIDILPKPKRVGDLKCTDEIECKYCPLRMADCTCTKNSILYKLLEEIKGIALSGDYFDQEIYNLLKARLDREVTDK